MTTFDGAKPGPAYPIGGFLAGEGDRRFSYSLLNEVAGLIETHGYPNTNGSDLNRLHLMLFRFLYGDGPA